MINLKKFKDYKLYFTHDNGALKYAVYIKNMHVYVYKKDKTLIDSWVWKKRYRDNAPLYTVFVKHYKCKDIFIGKSPKCKITDFSGYIGEAGNSILICVKKFNYVYIGHSIKKFTTYQDVIRKYWSPIGNNDVPYPIALGDKYVYNIVYPIGYISKELYNKLDINSVIDTSNIMSPWLIPFNKTQSHYSKKNTISVDEFNEIRKLKLDDIPLSTIKSLAKMYNVASRDTKREIATNLYKLRGIKLHS